jgi:hypothetical protein
MCERQCALCGSPLGVFGGTLGRLVWWLCRDCGMQFSSECEPAAELMPLDEDGLASDDYNDPEMVDFAREE